MLISVVTDELRAALADPLRARIVELLAGEQLCTCHLVELTGARQTNISNHLRVLRAAGLVEPQPAGRGLLRGGAPEESESETADGAVDGDEDGFEVDEAADLGRVMPIRGCHGWIAGVTACPAGGFRTCGRRRPARRRR